MIGVSVAQVKIHRSSSASAEACCPFATADFGHTFPGLRSKAQGSPNNRNVNAAAASERVEGSSRAFCLASLAASAFLQRKFRQPREQVL